MGEGNLYCLTSQRVERWERMGEDVAGSLDGKGRRGALLALQSTGFASSRLRRLRNCKLRRFVVGRSAEVVGYICKGKEGNAASFYTNNSHNPADVALCYAPCCNPEVRSPNPRTPLPTPRYVLRSSVLRSSVPRTPDSVLRTPHFGLPPTP